MLLFIKPDIIYRWSLIPLTLGSEHLALGDNGQATGT